MTTRRILLGIQNLHREGAWPVTVWSAYLETLEVLLAEREPGWTVFNLADEVAQFKPPDGYWITITGVELRAEGTTEAAVEYVIARAREEMG